MLPVNGLILLVVSQRDPHSVCSTFLTPETQPLQGKGQGRLSFPMYTCFFTSCSTNFNTLASVVYITSTYICFWHLLQCDVMPQVSCRLSMRCSVSDVGTCSFVMGPAREHFAQSTQQYTEWDNYANQDHTLSIIKTHYPFKELVSDITSGNACHLTLM